MLSSDKERRVSWGPTSKRMVAGIYLTKLWHRDRYTPAQTAAILARGNIAIHVRLKGEMSEACLGLGPNGWAYVASLIKDGRATGVNVYIDEPYPQIAERAPVVTARPSRCPRCSNSLDRRAILRSARALLLWDISGRPSRAGLSKGSKLGGAGGTCELAARRAELMRRIRDANRGAKRGRVATIAVSTIIAVVAPRLRCSSVTSLLPGHSGCSCGSPSSLPVLALATWWMEPENLATNEV